MSLDTQGDAITASDHAAPHHTTLHVRRRFQFSSALKRMSTICSLPNGKNIIAVKGAPETIKGMLTNVPSFYDHVFQRYTRRGSRVLALGYREVDNMSADKVRIMLDVFEHFHDVCSMQINKITRDHVETSLTFVGFLVFHCRRQRLIAKLGGRQCANGLHLFNARAKIGSGSGLDLGLSSGSLIGRASEVPVEMKNDELAQE